MADAGLRGELDRIDAVLAQEYETKTQQWAAAKAVIDRLAEIRSLARRRLRVSQHTLEAARQQARVARLSEYETDVIVISVALIAGAVAAFACPLLVPALIRGAVTTGTRRQIAGQTAKLSAKAMLRLRVVSFAVSSGSQFAISYAATGKGTTVFRQGLRFTPDLLAVELERISPTLALVGSVKPEDMYDFIHRLSARAREEAAKVTSDEDERWVLRCKITHDFWNDVVEESTAALWANAGRPEFFKYQMDAIWERLQAKKRLRARR